MELSRADIKKYLYTLNDKLKNIGEHGELILFGGAVMSLVHDFRKSTEDIDAIYSPKEIINKISEEIAEEFSLNKNWLNDSVKGFIFSKIEKEILLNMSNLRVYAVAPDYMLAMKLTALRRDTKDIEDIKFLLEYLDIKYKEDLYNLLHKYIPERMINIKTKFFIEEIFSKERGDFI